MNKEEFPDDYFWPHDTEKIYDHLNELERLWDNHVSDLELIKKWMVLPITEALSMLMEADALMTRMGNRIEYIKTTEVAFFFIGRLNEMQKQCKCLRSFIDGICNSLYYKKEAEEHPHRYSRDIPFKRPVTLFDGIIPDEFDSDRIWYKPMSLDDYSSIIWHINSSVNNIYLSLERLTSYVLEAKEGFEIYTSDYEIMADIELFKLTNLYTKQRQELLERMPQSVRRNGKEPCIEWLKQNELLCFYLDTKGASYKTRFPKADEEKTSENKRRNAIILKAISAGPAEWVKFLSYLALYDELINGLCVNDDYNYAIVDEIEASLHPELQKEIYDSYSRLHPEQSSINQSRHKHFPPCINKEQGIELFRFLVKYSYIDATADESSFLFLMGCTSEQPKELLTIRWVKNKQLLRELLEMLFQSLIESKSLRKVELEKLTPYCFENKDGKPLRLAKWKDIFSTDSDNLKKFIATILRPS